MRSGLRTGSWSNFRSEVHSRRRKGGGSKEAGTQLLMRSGKCGLPQAKRKKFEAKCGKGRAKGKTRSGGMLGCVEKWPSG